MNKTLSDGKTRDTLRSIELPDNAHKAKGEPKKEGSVFLSTSTISYSLFFLYSLLSSAGICILFLHNSCLIALLLRYQ